LAIRGVQRHEIGVEGTLEISAKLRREEEEEEGGKVSLGANRACCSTIWESVEDREYKNVEVLTFNEEGRAKPEEELEKPLLGRGKYGAALQWVGDMGTLQNVRIGKLEWRRPLSVSIPSTRANYTFFFSFIGPGLVYKKGGT